MEDAEIDPHKCVQMIFDKGAKSVRWRKGSFFNKLCWNNWVCGGKERNLGLSFTAYPTMNSTWIMDLNVRHRTRRFLDSNRKSSSPWSRKRALRLKTKSHKRKN